jgi:hypothetical protein
MLAREAFAHFKPYLPGNRAKDFPRIKTGSLTGESLRTFLIPKIRKRNLPSHPRFLEGTASLARRHRRIPHLTTPSLASALAILAHASDLGQSAPPSSPSSARDGTLLVENGR